MLSVSQRHKEEPLKKIIPVAWRMLFSLLFILPRHKEKWGKAGEFQKFWRNLTANFFCSYSEVANFICQFYLCNCLAAPPASQAFLSHSWGTDCSPLQQARPSGTFRILSHSFFLNHLTPTHFTLLQSLHYTLQAHPYTDSKMRTTIPDSFLKAISVFQSGKQFMENSFHFLCCPTCRRGMNTEALQKCEFFGRIRPFNNTRPENNNNMSFLALKLV